MTSSLPESIDGLYRFSSFSDAVSSQTSLSINPDTLWSKLNECDKCVFFRNMVSKSLYATDYNNANTDVKTIFVPRDSRNNFFNIQNEITPNDFVSSLTIPGQLFIMPKSSPINIKVQNKNKEYLSINIKDVNKGGQAFVQVLDRLWIIVVPNIMCTNGIIHLMEEVYAFD
ncbi:putative protein 096L [Cricket iridovirus]|uniref:FAS1 domain-containing protein n=2 Tax=Iridoviridae TaxID=10486 RepID=A0A5B8RH37_9VIRU|nr:putative protein 096L [Iridovirus Liz-CrIV]UIB20829.1 putative protein 096L [Cricket iridovirus]